jgi:hypothetical protein
MDIETKQKIEAKQREMKQKIGPWISLPFEVTKNF